MILNNPKSAIFLEPVPPQSRQPHKVLVVDDDPVIRDMMVDILEMEGYTATVARNGFEALELLHQDESYLVFLDMLMPGMSGKELCRELESEPHIRQRHVIVMMSALDRIDEAMRCKVEAVMPKPFLVDDVVRVLEPYQETLQ
ncbi:MAG TPA: response regulator [Ktedonobacteraceae bacterium]|jgi:CheY-like chemotaxis protein|nr:response regulator [Ktedonobacteraceae bacterium]